MNSEQEIGESFLYDGYDKFWAKDGFDDNDIAALRRLSQHQDSEVRYYVAELLVNADATQAEDILVPMLDDKEYLVRVNACDSLCISSNPKVLELLKKVLIRDKSALVRHYAALSIGDIASKSEIKKEELLRFLEQRLHKEKTEHTKIAFFSTMFVLGEEKYFQYLLEQLKGVKYRNRCATVNTLAYIASVKNREEIITALEELKKTETTVAVNSTLDRVLNDLAN